VCADKVAAAAHWDGVYRGRPDVWGPGAHPLAELLARRLANGGAVLDLGCGTGANCLHLARAGIRSLGVDLSREAVDLALQRKTRERDGRADFIRADMLDFLRACPAGAFDGVLSVNVLNHLGADIEEALRHVRRALRPGGCVALSLFTERDEEWGGPERSASAGGPAADVPVRLLDRGQVRAALTPFTVQLLLREEYLDAPHPGAPFRHRNSFWRILATRPQRQLPAR
jgi:SAM-dependent methyltransferase